MNVETYHPPARHAKINSYGADRLRARRNSRQLSAEERTLLSWLLEHGTPDARGYSPQLDDIRVVDSCDCGCPTIFLEAKPGQGGTTGPSYIVADFYGKAPEGYEVGVLVHVREGCLSELEVYDITGKAQRFSLPSLDSLRDIPYSL